jgi:sestrin
MMKKSADALRGRKKSWGELLPEGDDVWDDESLTASNMEPGQIGGFVRIVDDELRMRGMNMVVSMLKEKIEERDEEFLSQCVLTILRLSLESAFVSAREAFSEIVELIKKADFKSVRVPADPVVVTRWIRPDVLPSVKKADGECDGECDGLTQRLLRNIDVMEGRIPHVIVALAWHPTFLEKWYRTMMHVMRGTGPLPFTWRRFISIVACARFQCMPMLKLQEIDFLQSGGDSSWLTEGIAAPSLPPKLYALMELNALLAHRPWNITAAKMEELLSSEGAAWSVGELVHAISIMVTFHSICGVVWGLGLTPEIDITETFSSTMEAEAEKKEENAAEDKGDDRKNTDRLISMLKTGSATFSKQRQNWAASGEQTKNTIWAEAEKDGSKVTKLLQEQSVAKAGDASLQYCQRYIGPFVMEYTDFDIASNSIFYKAQYNFGSDGYALVHQVLDGLAPLLGAELQHISTLTYNRFADVDADLDTTALRDAVWHYTHRIKGLLDDDYNYAEVNELLNRQMKYYIKKITCFPHTINMTDFVNLGYDLLPSEKCHIALLATEAAKEAALSYALKALSSYMKFK